MTLAWRLLRHRPGSTTPSDSKKRPIAPPNRRIAPPAQRLRFGHGRATPKEAKPAPTVIVLTDDPYLLYRQKCLEAKADFVFSKSAEFDQVVPVLNQLIQQARDNGERR